VFVHCYLELISKGYLDAAKEFFQKHAKSHQRLHLTEVRQLSMVLTREQLQLNEFAKQVLNSKFNIQLSLLSFQLLHTFLSDHQLFLILYLLNERVNLIVASNHPELLIQSSNAIQPQRALVNLVSKEESPSFETSGILFKNMCILRKSYYTELG